MMGWFDPPSFLETIPYIKIKVSKRWNLGISEVNTEKRTLHIPSEDSNAEQLNQKQTDIK